jgi:hypothetical protein
MLLREAEPDYLNREEEADALREPAIHSSPRDLRDLARTAAWQDIKRRLLYSLMSRRDSLETLGEEQYDSQQLVALISYTQGEIFNIRTMLEMPERLARQKEMENEYERREQRAEEESKR